jgi:hypothetical protein
MNNITTPTQCYVSQALSLSIISRLLQRRHCYNLVPHQSNYISMAKQSLGEKTDNDRRTTMSRHCVCYSIHTGRFYNNSCQDDVDDIMIPSSTLRCSACVQKVLQPYLERHKQAVIDHQRSKNECSIKLAQISDPTRLLMEFQAESERLRDQLVVLRQECGDMAVRVASQAVENDNHRETMGLPMDRQEQDMRRLEESLLEASMTNAIHTATDHVRFLRFQWARKVLWMHRLDIDPEDIKLTPLQKRRQSTQPEQQLRRRARGIGKIAGLPLPNAGPELYGVLPPRELQSALRLVAMVTSTVARCLGIVLPHPILLTMTSDPPGDITDTVSEEALMQWRLKMGETSGEKYADDGDDYHSHRHHQTNHFHPLDGSGSGPTSNSQAPVGFSSTSSLLSLIDGSYWTTKAKKALAKATGHPTVEKSSQSSDTFILPSMDATIVTQRLSHATAAVLVDDSTVNNNSSKFILSADAMHQDEFAIALQLLQNNVIVLCIRAGVPVSKLWPAEAMLLNLYELDQYCQQQTAVSF